MGMLLLGGEGAAVCPVQPVLQVLVLLVLGWGDSLEGETWFSSLEITSTQRLLGRNIKTQADISQVFYQALSDPIPAYHTLHTLKHGYPFLDTLLTFKCKRWEETRLVSHRMEEVHYPVGEPQTHWNYG